jgi:hypothetical protein
MYKNLVTDNPPFFLIIKRIPESEIQIQGDPINVHSKQEQHHQVH